LRRGGVSDLNGVVMNERPEIKVLPGNNFSRTLLFGIAVETIGENGRAVVGKMMKLDR
jgi:hypothetical protein